MFFVSLFCCLKQSSACCKNTFVLCKNIFEGLAGDTLLWFVSILPLRQNIPALLTRLSSHSVPQGSEWSHNIVNSRPGRILLQQLRDSPFYMHQGEWEKASIHAALCCVLVDMPQLYKILRSVSSQRPVSKHAASVCLQPCLSLRPQSARITQSKAPSFNRTKMKYWFICAECWTISLWTSRFCAPGTQD